MDLQKNDRGYYYFDLFSGAHDHIRTRIWVHRSFVRVRKEELLICGEKRIIEHTSIELPARGARVVKTERGNLVLRPHKGSVVYLVEVPSGYRGWADITRIDGGEIVAEGHHYRSGRGALGCTAWALVNGGSEGIVYAFDRSGRRIDPNEPREIRLLPDGTARPTSEDELDELLG